MVSQHVMCLLSTSRSTTPTHPTHPTRPPAVPPLTRLPAKCGRTNGTTGSRCDRQSGAWHRSSRDTPSTTGTSAAVIDVWSIEVISSHTGRRGRSVRAPARRARRNPSLTPRGCRLRPAPARADRAAGSTGCRGGGAAVGYGPPTGRRTAERRGQAQVAPEMSSVSSLPGATASRSVMRHRRSSARSERRLRQTDPYRGWSRRRGEADTHHRLRQGASAENASAQGRLWPRRKSGRRSPPRRSRRGGGG